MISQVSNDGLLEILEHEGIVPAPYLDSVGRWTWGAGHTAAAGGVDPEKLPRGMPRGLDAAIADVLSVFRDDIAKYEARVRAAIKVPVKQHEFDALVGFDLNTGGIFKAKLTGAINAGEANAARHFMGWLKPPEIKARREDEMNLFRTGDYAANGSLIPIYKVNSRGQRGGILKTLTQVDALRLINRLNAPQIYVTPVPERKTASAWETVVNAIARIFK